MCVDEFPSICSECNPSSCNAGTVVSIQVFQYDKSVFSVNKTYQYQSNLLLCASKSYHSLDYIRLLDTHITALEAARAETN